MSRNDPEFTIAFEKLYETEIDGEYEVWQYMGTEFHKDGKWHHCFRHRMNPKNNDLRSYIFISPSENWIPGKKSEEDNWF